MTSSVNSAIAETLFLFLDWPWSNTAREGRKVLERISERVVIRLPMRFGCPDTDEKLAEWLTKECERTGLPLHGGGFGTLLEVRNGETVAWIEDVHAAPLADVEAFISSTDYINQRRTLLT